MNFSNLIHPTDAAQTDDFHCLNCGLFFPPAYILDNGLCASCDSLSHDYPQDYVFVSARHRVLGIETLEPDEVTGHAQRLARRHGTAVTVAMVIDREIEPDRCGNCGGILPEDGPCPCSDFGETTK